MGKGFDANHWYNNKDTTNTHSKVQLKLSLTRLELQKTKKQNNLINTKREIAELLKAGKDESARIKARKTAHC